MRNNGRTTDYACKKNGKVTKTSVWRANNKKWVKKKTDIYLTGSITVFLSLMLAFVLAAVFSLLEGARVWGLEKRVSTDAVQTGHSLMAEYTPSLWKDYHVLFLDGSYEKDVFSIANVEERGMMFSVESQEKCRQRHGICLGYIHRRWNWKPMSWQLIMVGRVSVCRQLLL